MPAAPRPAPQRVAVQREENNPRDRHALLVTHALLGMPIGHLPRSVAGHLAQVVKLQVGDVVLRFPCLLSKHAVCSGALLHAVLLAR